MFDLQLRDVHVLVTGASGGIGLETSRLFLEQGAKITAHYNTNPKTLSALVSQYGSNRIQVIQADLRLGDSVANLFTSAISRFGPIQVAIVNHGIWTTKDEPLQSMSFERWTNTIDTNLNSSFLVSREFLRQLRVQASRGELEANARPDEQIDSEPEVNRKESPCLVLVGSDAGKYGEAMHADYAASKSAMMYGLTLSLKNEIVKIAPRGRVNCVTPGWIRTSMTEEALSDPAVVSRALATTPLKKIGTPYDVATQIVWIASSKASGHVSGQIIDIAGGEEGFLVS